MPRKKTDGTQPEVWIDSLAALDTIDRWDAQEPNRPYWQPPKNPQPIDGVIAKLRIATRGPRLRNAAELMRLRTPILCPYDEARAEALLAAADVHEGMVERDGTLARQYEDYARRAERLAEDLMIFLGGVPINRVGGATHPIPIFLATVPKRPAMDFNKGEWELRATLAHDAGEQIRSATASLAQLADLARSARAALVPTTNAKLTEEQIYVERVGNLWRNLTGQDPSPDSPLCIEFIEASYKTATLDWRERKWTSAVDRVRERRRDVKTYPGNTPEHEA